jgi:hypothetical protein
MSTSSKESAIVVVIISFLAIILIYSSVAKFNAFARNKIESGGCTTRDPTKPGATSAKECCWTVTDYDKSGRITDVYSLCQTCEYDSSGNKIDCRDTSPSRSTGLGNTLPPSAGFAQPPSTTPPPPSNALPPSSSSALPSQSKQQTTLTTTCPDGSARDANGNCPSSTTTNQQVVPSQHHHKGSNNNLQGGQESTPTPTTKKGKTPKTG